jgi:hypothetical protein
VQQWLERPEFYGFQTGGQVVCLHPPEPRISCTNVGSGQLQFTINPEFIATSFTTTAKFTFTDRADLATQNRGFGEVKIEYTALPRRPEPPILDDNSVKWKPTTDGTVHILISSTDARIDYYTITEQGAEENCVRRNTTTDCAYKNPPHLVYTKLKIQAVSKPFTFENVEQRNISNEQFVNVMMPKLDTVAQLNTALDLEAEKVQFNYAKSLPAVDGVKYEYYYTGCDNVPRQTISSGTLDTYSCNLPDAEVKLIIRIIFSPTGITQISEDTPAETLFDTVEIKGST